MYKRIKSFIPLIIIFLIYIASYLVLFFNEKIEAFDLGLLLFSLGFFSVIWCIVSITYNRKENPVYELSKKQVGGYIAGYFLMIITTIINYVSLVVWLIK